MQTKIKSFVISAVVASSLGALAVNIPNSFTAGAPIKASDVNDNFSSLKTALDPLQAFATKLSTTPCAAGQAVGSVGSDGTPGCVSPGIKVPFSIIGSGGGIPNATFQASNTNSGIAAVISQVKTGTSDATLVIGQSGDGPLIKGFGANGGGDELRVDTNGTVHLFTPATTDNIVLDNSNGQITASGGLLGKSPNVVGVTAVFADGRAGTETIAFDGINTSSVRATANFSNTGTGPLICARYAPSSFCTFNVLNDGTVVSKGVTLSSDRNAKTNFSSVDGSKVLEKVSRLPISQWSYKSDAADLRHIGPMAQDFHAAFGLNGSDDTHISMIDEGGVALTAIQGLYAQNRALEAENATLRSSFGDFEKRLSALERR